MSELGTQSKKTAGEDTSLYEKRAKIHPLWVKGRFQSLRNLSFTALIPLYFILPWLQWGGRQAIWFNLPERKFYIFGLTFWPQDFALLSWLLLIAAFALFFFTVYAGRLWCGYACPQTVWTKFFMWIEYKIEGDRNQRIKLDRSPWNLRKVRYRLLKYLVWALFAFLIALTAIGFFTPVHELISDLVAFQLSATNSFWLLFLSVFCFLCFTSLREQVCIFMCPYARFQGVMFDSNTLIISYDENRGEPRGSRKKQASMQEQGLGSCIDCKHCYYACPTGIDIRDGLQSECIGCAACIDACDIIMLKMGYEPGLVRYSTAVEMAGGVRKKITPRLVSYAAALIVMLALFGSVLSTRVPVELDIKRDRNRLYRQKYDGSVANVYTLKIMNKDQRGHLFMIGIDSEVVLQYSGKREVYVEAGKMLALPLDLIANPEDIEASRKSAEVFFTVVSSEVPRFSITEKTKFIYPAFLK